MLTLVTVYLCFLFIPLYFMRLFADGRKLRSKLPLRLMATAESTPTEEGLLFRPNYEEWTEPLPYSDSSGTFEDQPPAS